MTQDDFLSISNENNIAKQRIALESETLKLRGNFAVLGTDKERVSKVLGVFEEYEEAAKFKDKKTRAGLVNVRIHNLNKET